MALGAFKSVGDTLLVFLVESNQKKQSITALARRYPKDAHQQKNKLYLAAM